jgi:hypothetical protein
MANDYKIMAVSGWEALHDLLQNPSFVRANIKLCLHNVGREPLWCTDNGMLGQSAVIFIVKVVLGPHPRRWGDGAGSPGGGMTRTTLLGTFHPQSAIIRQIEGRGDAFLEAQWNGT